MPKAIAFIKREGDTWTPFPPTVHITSIHVAHKTVPEEYFALLFDSYELWDRKLGYVQDVPADFDIEELVERMTHDAK